MKPKLWDYKREYYFYPHEREEIELWYKNRGWTLVNDHLPCGELRGYLEFFKPTEFFVGLFRTMLKNKNIQGYTDR